MREETDERLVEHLTTGRTEALDELYRRYAGKLLVFCSNTMSAREPQDAVHDVFERVIEASHQFDPSRAPFRVWVYRIARNRCIDLARRDGRIRFVPLEGDTVPDRGRSEDRASLIAKAVRDCLAALSDGDERQAFILYYLSDKVFREVGAILGKSVSMAQKRVKVAREKMKRCLSRKGIAA